MIYLLFEQEYNVINPVETEFVKRYNKASIKRFSGDATKADFAGLTNAPVLNREWLIICSGSFRHVRDLYPTKNTILWKVTRRAELEHALLSLDGMQFKLVDNYKISPDVVRAWICRELGVTEKIAKTLYNRCAGNLKALVTAVDVLKGLDTITRSAVIKNVPKVNGVSCLGLVQYLIGEQTRYSRVEIVQFIYEFRYAFSWLKTQLLSEIKKYLNVFLDVDSGDLQYGSVHEYVQNNKTLGISEYRLQKMIEAHRYVSTEKIYLLSLMLQELPSGSDGVVQLLKIVEVGGYDEYFM